MTSPSGDTPRPVPGFRADQLSGFRIGVTSDRRSEDLIDAFERRGAKVIHAPTLRIAHAQHDEPLIADTRAIIDSSPDILLATTSYGIRRWLEVADAAGLGDSLLEALSAMTILVRGPKARGAIRAAGLLDSGMSEQETTASLVSKVLAEYPDARSVAVQLHGYTDNAQLDRITGSGRQVRTVAPYRWATPDDTDERVARLVEAVISGNIDVLTFTSAPAVDALFAAAESSGSLSPLIEALQGGVVTAAVGPVTAAPLINADIHPLIPERFRMGALIRLVCEHLERDGIERIETLQGPVELRGSVVILPRGTVSLGPSAHALFRRLVRARGDVVTRAELAAVLPGTTDEHAIEVALSRLRQTLDTPGLVSTVVKRGYRLNV